MRGQSFIAVLASILYVLLSSAAFVAIKIGVTYCPPLTLLLARFVVAGALMWGIVRWLDSPWPATRAGWMRLVVIGVLHTLLPALFVFLSMRHLSASMATILLSTNPLVLCLTSPWVLGESLSLARIVGLLFGFGGVVYVMSARLGAGGRADTPLGVFFVCLTVISMVAATIVFKRFPPRESVLVVNAVQILVSAALLIVPVLVFEDPRHAVINVPLVASLLYLVLGVTTAAMLLWFWLLARGEASATSSYLFLSPLFGLGLAALFLHERFTLRDGVGLIAVSMGIVLIQRRRVRVPLHEQ